MLLIFESGGLYNVLDFDISYCEPWFTIEKPGLFVRFVL